MDYTLHAATDIDAPADLVFQRITDIAALPRWNAEVAKVVECPAILEPGAQWVVEIRALETHWNSRAEAVEVDRSGGRFAYRSASDDGNPSHADWRWTVTGAAGNTASAHVAVEADIRPRTFWRRHLFSKVRRPSLAKAMERSLEQLAVLETIATDEERA